MTNLKISPSSLTFLLDECPRCWYMAVHGIYKRPYAPFPSMFNKMDKLMRGVYQGQSSLEITGKEGVFDTKECKLLSPPIPISDHHTIQFSGKTDCLIRFSDLTLGILDFKTSDVSPDTAQFYAPQLYAYRQCMEVEVSKMGLLCASPIKAKRITGISMDFSETWVEIPINEDYWQGFTDKISTLLLTPFEWVKGKENCPHCEYQRKLQS